LSEVGEDNWSVLRNELERLARGAVQMESLQLKEIANLASPNPPAGPGGVSGYL
jgi:hypothetical protein